MDTLEETPTEAKKVEISHEYHAEAHVLNGRLLRPVEQEIQHHARVALQDERGGHFTQRAGNFSLEGLITFESGLTRVSGSPSLKPGHGWVTLSTSILEGLNVFEIVTADRVVAQVSTEHPKVNGHVPHVTFLGTRFENFQISGYPVKVELDFGICGAKPANDKPYREDPAFLNRVMEQYKTIIDDRHAPNYIKAQYEIKSAYLEELGKGSRINEGEFLNRVIEQCQIIIGDPKAPEDIKAQYQKKREHLQELCNRSGIADNGGRERRGDSPIQCSLVKTISGDLPDGVKAYGNMIEIPDFGIVSLAEVEVGTKESKPSYEVNRSTYKPANGNRQSGGQSNYFTLRMFNMQLGCVGHGEVQGPTASSNGKTRP